MNRVENRIGSSHMVHQLTDFANIFKAFIGANFLSIPYALRQSGLTTGVLGLLITAFLTDHCCRLLVKCKDLIVDRIDKEFKDVTETPGSLSPADESEHTALKERIQISMSYTDIGRICLGPSGVVLVNVFLLLTQFSFCVAYFIFIGNALYRIAKPGAMSKLLPLDDNMTSDLSILNTSAFNNSNTTESLSVTMSNVSNIAYGMSVKGRTTPPLEALILTPLPILLLLSLIKNIRFLGYSSVLANGSLLVSFIVITIYTSIGFKIGPNVQYVIQLHTFPVLFGQLVSAYEGIGLIIPIQSSMVGNRKYFKPMLSSAIILLTVVFLVFGSVGYLRYGEKTAQTMNLTIVPQSGVLSILVNVTLILAVLLTFPLQMVPVYDIVEPLVFGQALANKKDIPKIENERLLWDKVRQEDMPIPTSKIPDDVPYLKRDVLRAALVVVAALLAILCRNIFAYVIAISGAVGSTSLVFILPALFHIKLNDGTLSVLDIARDVVLVIIGTVGGTTSFVYSIKEIVDVSNGKS